MWVPASTGGYLGGSPEPVQLSRQRISVSTLAPMKKGME